MKNNKIRWHCVGYVKHGYVEASHEKRRAL
mgnify:CR=1 FL=1|jgi:hypothetical protein